jgi:hypothetical protein
VAHRLAVLALAWLALTAAGGATIRFAAHPQPPPPDIPLEGRRVRPIEGGDRGPLGALIARRATTLEVTWWDARVFVKESAARDYLGRLLGNPRGTTLPHIFWAQMLPVANLAADVVDTEGRRGRLLVWHQLPSVYAVWRDADARWWFAHWMDDPELRVPADAP